MFVFVADPSMAYISERPRLPDPNKRGHLNSDISGLTPKIKMEKESNVAGSSKRKRKNASNI